MLVSTDALPFSKLEAVSTMFTPAWIAARRACPWLLSDTRYAPKPMRVTDRLSFGMTAVGNDAAALLLLLKSLLAAAGIEPSSSGGGGRQAGSLLPNTEP